MSLRQYNDNNHQKIVRIIGGKWKRTSLPLITVKGLRPTPARVRETIFNWLTHLIDDWKTIHCLDIFAGSGALGFEAASRGANSITMIEYNSLVIHQLQINKKKLHATKIKIYHGDALILLKILETKWCKKNFFELIFVDPPYYQNFLIKIMPLCEQLLAKKGLIYVESENALTNQDSLKWMINWKIIRADHAGSVFYHLLQYKRNY